MTGKLQKIIASVFIILIACVLGFSVKSYAEDLKGKEYRKAVKEKENEYVHEVRVSLEEYGFKNAGVNLTKSYDEDRNVTYELVINHHSFEYADYAKLCKIENELYEEADHYLEGDLRTEFSY